MFSGRWVGSVGSNGYLRSVCAGFLLRGHGVMLPLGDGQFKMVQDSSQTHEVIQNLVTFYRETFILLFYGDGKQQILTSFHLILISLWIWATYVHFCCYSVLIWFLKHCLNSKIPNTPFFFFSTLLTLHLNALVVKLLAKKQALSVFSLFNSLF